MPDIGAGSILSAGASLVGGMMQSEAAESAASAQERSTADAIAAQREALQLQLEMQREALAEQRRQYDTGRSDLEPWRNMGAAALGRLGELMGLNATTAVNFDPVRAREEAAMAAGLKAPTWEDAEKEHLNAHIRWAGTGYQSGSDPAVIKSQTQAIFDAMKADYDAKLAAMPLPTAPTAAPGAQGTQSEDFGRLNRQFTVDDFWNDPVTKLSYQFGLDEGRKGLERMAASRGRLNSSATLQELTRYGTDYAGTQAAASRGRYLQDQDTLYNRLAGLSGTGQSATSSMANLGSQYSNAVGQNATTVGNYLWQYANNVGGLQTALGNARGAAAIGGANAWGNALGNIGNYFGQQDTLDKVLKSRGVYGYNPSGGYSGYNYSNAYDF